MKSKSETHVPIPTMVVTGASGLLGGSLCAAASAEHRVCGTFLNHPVTLPGVEMHRIDLSKESAAAEIAAIKPSVIVHCAAMTDVEACEQHPEEAYRHNVDAARHAAEAAVRAGAYLIHISTDGLFGGEKGCYTETDAPRPVNVYAESKRRAEIEVFKVCPGAAVVRTTIYGWNVIAKKSLAEWVLSKLRAGEDVPGFTDTFFSPILVDDLSVLLLKLCGLRQPGLLHVAGSERCSKFDFARTLASVFGFDPQRVKAAKASEVKFKAKRPRDVSLDVSKAQKILDVKFPGVREGLLRFKSLERADAGKQR